MKLPKITFATVKSAAAVVLGNFLYALVVKLFCFRLDWSPAAPQVSL